jgi:hypothetical protein
VSIVKTSPFRIIYNDYPDVDNVYKNFDNVYKNFDIVYKNVDNIYKNVDSIDQKTNERRLTATASLHQSLAVL